MRLRRAWVNGKLAYDVTGSGKLDADSAKFLSGIRFYSGSETQMPDSALEALPVEDGGGVGNVLAYRGLCYAVLPDCDVTEAGGAVPIVKWEVVSSGTQLTSSPFPNWIATNGDGKFQLSNGTDWQEHATYTTSALGNDLLYSDGVLVCSGSDGAAGTKYSTDRGATFADSTVTGSESAGQIDGYHGNVIDGMFWIGQGGANIAYSTNGASFTSIHPADPINGTVAGIGIGGTLGYIVSGSNAPQITTTLNGWVNTSTYALFGTGSGPWAACIGSNGARTVVFSNSLRGGYRYTDDGSTWSVEASFPAGLGDPKQVDGHGNNWVVVGSSGIAYSTDNAVTWTLVSLSETFVGYGVRYGGGLWVACGNDGGGSLSKGRIWTASDSDLTTWTKRTNNFTTSGDSIASVVFMECDGFAVPDAPGWYVHADGTLCGASATTVTPDTIDLESVAGDLTERGGVSDYDVTALDGIQVLGFAIMQPTTASACLQELQKVYFWDYPEWGNSGDTFPKLRAVRRGGASVVNLTDDDLVDVDDDEDTRRQLAEFPRKVNFIAPDPDHDYEPITQSSERESENVTSTSEVTISTAVAFTRDMAAPIADKMLRIACEEAQGQIKRTVPEWFTQYTTSDIATYGGRRYRIDMIDAQDGESIWTLTRDRASAYESNATGSTGVAVPDPVSTLRGPTVFQALNLPRLVSSDVGPGMYIGVCGLLAGWQGCDLYLSVDGGTTETKVATIIDPATMGWLTADLDSGDTLSVHLYSDDELDDATDAQLGLRMNACAVTTDEVSEILQFKNATDTGTRTYDLTTLSRAQLGTTETAHYYNDPFIVLDGSQYFLQLDISLAGKELIFRPVTRGTVPANNDTYTVTFRPKFYGAQIVENYTDDSGEAYTDDSGDPYYKVLN